MRDSFSVGPLGPFRSGQADNIKNSELSLKHSIAVHPSRAGRRRYLAYAEATTGERRLRKPMSATP
jgi:hypothetical protein